MSNSTAHPGERRGHYGVDAPYVPILMSLAGTGFLIFALSMGLSGGTFGGTLGPLAAAALLLFSSASYVYATRVGKFHVWAKLLRDSELSGTERLLDVGCGRGAVLLLAAKLLPRGRVVGIDLWKTSDQSGNRRDVTIRNAELEGVRDRVEVHTGDMRSLPFEGESFDVVVSSLAIHNLGTADERGKAIDEAVRVLRPGGRILIADIRATDEYADRLRRRGMTSVRRRGLGWHLWYGGPWVATSLVTATKPA